MKKKEGLQKKYRISNAEDIFIVKKTIESWYLAGLTIRIQKKHKLTINKPTESIGKEKFNQIIPKRFNSRIDFFQEILKDYSIEEAMKNNESIKYFFEKLSF